MIPWGIQGLQNILGIWIITLMNYLNFSFWSCIFSLKLKNVCSNIFLTTDVFNDEFLSCSRDLILQTLLGCSSFSICLVVGTISCAQSAAVLFLLKYGIMCRNDMEFYSLLTVLVMKYIRYKKFKTSLKFTWAQVMAVQGGIDMKNKFIFRPPPIFSILL